MRTSQRRQPAAPRRKSTGVPTAQIIVALVIPLVVYFGFSAGQRALEVYQLNQEASQIRAEIDALKGENARLRKQSDYIASDAYVEKIAREQLNLIKPGDRSVVVLAGEDRKETGIPVDPAVEWTDDTPNWLKWWNFFFGERR